MKKVITLILIICILIQPLIVLGLEVEKTEDNIINEEEVIEELENNNEEQPEESNENTTTPEKDTTAHITYRTHVQNIGWQNYVSDGSLSGTSGRSLRLEGINIKIESALEGSIEYTTHVQNIGWQNYVNNGEMAGTSGKALRLEGIRIRLTGELADYYDVYYRVHIQDFGWLGWTNNDQEAGSEGLSKRLEAIEIKLVEKNSTEMTVDENSFIANYASITYQAHVQNYGNMKEVGDSKTSGTVGKTLRLEALKINLNSKIEGNIEYQTYVAKTGWEEELRSSGEFTGTIGKSRAIQLIKINLTGAVANKYDIYYRVHTEQYGWLGWAKNGEIAGVSHYDIQAIQIKLIFKIYPGKNALSTNNHYIEQVRYTPIYFQQKDKRWNKKKYGSYYFGTTGCAPTAIAMAFSGILGKMILPTEVADFIYYHTNEYNKKTQGTSGMGIVKAAEHYDVKRTAIEDKEQLIEELKNGKIVYATMGNGKFAKPTYNHAIILFDYNKNNNTTNVYDPLNKNNNTMTSIDLIWNEQSIDPDDSTGGSNFHSLERY